MLGTLSNPTRYHKECARISYISQIGPSGRRGNGCGFAERPVGKRETAAATGFDGTATSGASLGLFHQSTNSRTDGRKIQETSTG
jgi:hypothetical protein